MTANGLLAVLYWLWAHLPVALVWPVSTAITVLLDGAVARQAGHRPRRHGRGEIQQESPLTHLGTFGLAAAWTAAGLASPPPIPHVGLAMWIGLLATPLSIPMERRQILSRLKWMLSVYTAAVGGFLLLMQSELSPAALTAWSQRLGQPGGGEALQAAVISSITPYAAAMLWVIGPLMYFGYIAQRFAVHSKTKVAPWATTEDRIRAMRTRGEG